MLSIWAGLLSTETTFELGGSETILGEISTNTEERGSDHKMQDAKRQSI